MIIISYFIYSSIIANQNAVKWIQLGDTELYVVPDILDNSIVFLFPYVYILFVVPFRCTWRKEQCNNYY